MAIQRGRAVGRPDGVRTAPGSGRECVRRSTRLCRGSRRRASAGMLRCSGRRAARRPSPGRRNGPGIAHRGNGPGIAHRGNRPGIPHRGVGGASRPDRGPERGSRSGRRCAAVPGRDAISGGSVRAAGRYQGAEEGELTELSATATAISAKPRGELVITLDNGQVWGEIAPGSKIKVKPGDAVKIEAGTLGSFILIAPNGRSSKVTRIR